MDADAEFRNADRAGTQGPAPPAPAWAAVAIYGGRRHASLSWDEADEAEDEGDEG